MSDKNIKYFYGDKKTGETNEVENYAALCRILKADETLCAWKELDGKKYLVTENRNGRGFVCVI